MVQNINIFSGRLNYPQLMYDSKLLYMDPQQQSFSYQNCFVYDERSMSCQ